MTLAHGESNRAMHEGQSEMDTQMEPPLAETAVLDCLRALQAIPLADRQYADGLMDFIARIYLNSSDDQTTARRRAYALLRISAEAVE